MFLIRRNSMKKWISSNPRLSVLIICVKMTELSPFTRSEIKSNCKNVWEKVRLFFLGLNVNRDLSVGTSFLNDESAEFKTTGMWMALLGISSLPGRPYLASKLTTGDSAPAEAPCRALPEARRSARTWDGRLSGDPAAEIPLFPQLPALWKPASRHNTPVYPTRESCRLIISGKWRRVAIKSHWKFPFSCLFSP